LIILGIVEFVFYLSGFVGKMFWWIGLFAIRGILVFERFASRGVILGNGVMANANAKPRKKDSARLAWDTKPRRAPNPKDIEFQTAEVVLPNPKVAGELPLSFRNGIIGEEEIDKQKMNRLIWGDCLLAMQALIAQGYEGKINLIYIDPPYDSKADYSHKMTIEGNEFTKEPSVIERLAYKDTWAGGADSYLDMLYPRLQLMKRLLAEDGTIYVHLDWHVSHYVKTMMDEGSLFGKEKFRNEIIWQRDAVGKGAKKTSNQWSRELESILVYSKTANCVFHQQYKYKDDLTYTQLKEFRYSDPDGRKFKIVTLGDYSEESIADMRVRNLIYTSSTGKKYKKYYLDEFQLAIGSLWNDIPNISHGLNPERLDFPTQKPEALLERILLASSNPGSLVGDFFAGSGTTGAVAGKLGRRWIMCELGKVGIQVTRARLVEMAAKPFLIENIGNYQREMIYLTGGRIWEMQHLILKLYGATPRDKTSGLGIRKIDNTEELVYVGYPDRPITAKKAEQLALQAKNLDGRGYQRLVILGWDYEYNYSQALESRLNALKDKINVEIKSRDIPPDIYDYLKKAKAEEEIEALADKVQFYERPYLRISSPELKELTNDKVQIKLSIGRYVLMDIPVSHLSKKGDSDYTALMKLAKDNFAVLIDYWAIDWDYDGCTFKSQWQAFRGNGRKAKTVTITATETLEKKKDRIIAVRVVDIFGNDAAAIVKI